VGLSWCIGPPGSGKTAAAVAVARSAVAAGRRVRWVALPTQRGAVLRRLVADGPLLGVEVVSLQQLAYAVATAAGAARPQIVGTARLALVAEALLERDGVLPTPGEAGLFAAAIAEAKRHGLGPADVARLAAAGSRAVAGVAGEVERWRDVFAAYERLKGAQLDYDDVRREARDRSEATAPAGLAALVGADLLVVDGLRELAPDDLAWLRRLAEGVETWVSVVLEPPAPLLADAARVERLPARPDEVVAWRFPNTVAEVRGVLRALARDLAEDHDPRDLAVVAPPGAARALRALAPEFGVELSEEAPRALVDAPFGRLLADLLELPTHPTAGRLLAVPALAAVGRRALAEGLTGPEAAARLAEQEGLGDVWRDWRAALTPSGDPLGWARQVVALAGDLTGGDDAERARAQEAALRRAQEAARLARAALAAPTAAPGAPETAGAEDGADGGFRAWWLALLRSSTLRERPRPGVALLTAAQATGRRFRRAYVVGAVAGAYDAGEREDYFVPEDARVPLDALLAARAAGEAGGAGVGAALLALPRRYRGLDPLVRVELRARADRVVVTHADGDRAGPLRPDAALLGAPLGDPPPDVPTASALEARPGVAYVATFDLVDGGEASVEDLRRAKECAFRAWAAPLVDDDPRAPWPARARRALTRAPRLDAERRGALAAEAPALAPWLERHASALDRLRFGVRLALPDGPSVRLDAVAREGDVVRLVRFTLPDEDPRAVVRPDQRWAELWAADLLRSRYPRQAARVELVAWPLGGEPVVLTPDGVDDGDWPRKRARVANDVAAAWSRWRSGPPRPNPGHRCRSCPLVDVCRPTQTPAPHAAASSRPGPGDRP
jgi:hypothetical protein